MYIQRGGSSRKVLVATPNPNYQAALAAQAAASSSSSSSSSSNSSSSSSSSSGTSASQIASQLSIGPYITIRSGKGLVNGLGYEPVLRITIGASNDGHGGFFRGLVSTGWSSNKTKSKPNLLFPFKDSSYAPGYYNAFSAKSHFTSDLTLIDGYFTRDFTPLWTDYFAVRGMIGLQYWNVPETCKLTFSKYEPDIFGQYLLHRNTYSAKTNNNLGIAALGLYFQIKPLDVLAAEIIAYAGAGGTFITSKTKLKVANNTSVLRKSHQLVGAGAYTVMSTVRAVYRPVDYFEIGVGWELFYAGGIAEAYKQMSKGTKPSSDNRVHHNSSIWFQGASLRIGFKL